MTYDTRPFTSSMSAASVMADEIEITPEMIDAGESILIRICDIFRIPAYYSVISAAKDVYIAMESARRE